MCNVFHTHFYDLLKMFLLLCLLVSASIFIYTENKDFVSDTTVKTTINYCKSMKTCAVVTAFSENHTCESIHACRTFANVSEIETDQIAVIAYYAPDVTNTSLQSYRNTCPFVQLRPLTMKQYPEFVHNLMNYRFKMLLVKEVLAEFDIILYGDASVRFRPNATNETLTDAFKSMETDFALQGIRMLGYANHRNYPATHPLMYNYFNVTVEQMKETQQLMATAFFVSNTTQGQSVIDKVSECALELNCMAPEGANLHCPYPEYTENTKVVCHRFDQSALNMRLIELYGTNQSLYYLPSKLIGIERMASCSL